MKVKAFQVIVKEIVTTSISMEYVQECGFTKVSEVYQSEYGYNGLSRKSCTDYLQGLPSVCTVPFANHEILEKLAAEGWFCENIEDEAKLIERYWDSVGNQFFKIIQKEMK